jgi:pimeloyl-ACP methyl ester carboxylesterase
MSRSIRAAIRVAVTSLFNDEEAPVLAAPMERPILLLHGFASNTRVLPPIERHLRRRRPTVRVPLGFGLRDVRDSAEIVHEILERIARAPDFRHADGVAHPLGGLAATYLLRCLDQGRHLRRVVTLGTPHRGISMALGGVFVVGVISRSVWQLLPDSDFLRRVARLPVPEGTELLSIPGGSGAVVPLERTLVGPAGTNETPACRTPTTGASSTKRPRSIAWPPRSPVSGSCARGGELDARAPAPRLACKRRGGSARRRRGDENRRRTTTIHRRCAPLARRDACSPG